MRQGLATAAFGLALGAGPALALELPADADPVLVDLAHSCTLAIAAGGAGLVEELVQSGWTSSAMNVDSQAYALHDEMFATKDYAGVGGASLRASVDDFPGYKLGTCVVSIDDLQRFVALDGLARVDGLTGFVKGLDNDVEGNWRSDAQSPDLFVRASQISDPDIFRFFMTTIEQADDAGF